LIYFQIKYEAKTKSKIRMNELNELISAHHDIEHCLQKITKNVFGEECTKCTDVCCREEFCRESIDIPFLRLLLSKSLEEYNQTSGWCNKNTGCVLTSGRPLVCYEFYCNKLHSNKHFPLLRKFSNTLKEIYVRVPYNQNLLISDDLERIPVNRLNVLTRKLVALKLEIKAAFNEVPY